MTSPGCRKTSGRTPSIVPAGSAESIRLARPSSPPSTSQSRVGWTRPSCRAPGIDSEVVAMNARATSVGWMSFDPATSPTRRLVRVRSLCGRLHRLLTDDHGTKITRGTPSRSMKPGCLWVRGLLSTGALSSLPSQEASRCPSSAIEHDLVMGVSPAGLPGRVPLFGGQPARPCVPRRRSGRHRCRSSSLPRLPVAANDAGIAVGGFHAAHENRRLRLEREGGEPLPMEVAKSINASSKVAGAKVIGSSAKDGSDTVFVTHAALWLGAQKSKTERARRQRQRLERGRGHQRRGRDRRTGSKARFLLTRSPRTSPVSYPIDACRFTSAHVGLVVGGAAHHHVELARLRWSRSRRNVSTAAFRNRGVHAE